MPKMGSTVDYCSVYPTEGHSWVTTMHAGVPQLVTRACVHCKYLDLDEIRALVAGAESTAKALEEAVAHLADNERLLAETRERAERTARRLDFEERAHTATEAVLRERIDRAEAEVEKAQLFLALHGHGVDPKGYYAGTPGDKLRALMEVLRWASVITDSWRDASPHGPLRNLIAAVDAYRAAKDRS